MDAKVIMPNIIQRLLLMLYEPWGMKTIPYGGASAKLDRPGTPVSSPLILGPQLVSVAAIRLRTSILFIVGKL